VERENTLLNINHLSIGFRQKDDITKVVDDISFQVNTGEILGIVGESGSGKTMTALSIMGLLSKEAIIMDGNIVFDNKNLMKIDSGEFRSLKGAEMAMIFQEPMTSLNPLLTVGYQVEEMLLLHETNLSHVERKKKALSALLEAGLKDTESLYHKYPHQLSGGMRQRVMIAMAMICNPKLLIADEPTTALDVTTQAKILSLLKKMNENHKTTIILISHDLGVINNICSRAIVMQNGHIVEDKGVLELFTSPTNEYTKKLIKASFLNKDKSTVSNANKDDTKIPHKFDDTDIKLNEQNLIVNVKDLSVFYYEKSRKLLSKKYKKEVVNQVSFFIKEGDVLGIVGESGSGKSTLAKAVVGLIKDKTGEIICNDSKPQMVFQDPYGSLNPVKKVGWILEEPLKLAGITKSERKKRVLAILNEIGLNQNHAERYLSQLSGGQRQRVAIGVALIQNSKFIVLDEPVSALDVTVQAQILELLKKLQKEYHLTYLFISHDLNVIREMCNQVCVMYQGKIVEYATIDELYSKPKHPYSKKLLDAALTYTSADFTL
jgi:peptide/nickel transport system ATP-binding protein